jgi:hypothetical protein
MEEEGSVINFPYDTGNACALHRERERGLSKNHLGFAIQCGNYLQVG